MIVKYKKATRLAMVQMFVNRALEYLGISDIEGTTISISFVDSISGGAHMADCMGDQWDVEIDVATDSTFLNQIRALGHELIHARQFLMGELDEEAVYWKGTDFSEAEYKDQPWEIEAHGFEDELFMKCFPWEVEIT